jgi:tetrahydromethanopterin S-methyltransferase subunit G
MEPNPGQAALFVYDGTTGQYNFADENDSDLDISATNGEYSARIGRLRGRPIGGMEPNPGQAALFIYDGTTGQYNFADENDSDLDISATNGEYSARIGRLRGRPIGGMEPNPGQAAFFVYDGSTGQYDFANENSGDLSIDRINNVYETRLARIQDLPIDFSDGLGDGMVMTCVNNPNGGLKFVCRNTSGGFALPFSQTVNLNTPMLNIKNDNNTTANLSGMVVDNRGRYGIQGISREGQANFNGNAVNTDFTFPAAVYGQHLNSNQAGVGVFGKAVGSNDDNEGIGGMFMGKSSGVLAFAFGAASQGALVGIGRNGARAARFSGGEVLIENQLVVNGGVNAVVKNFRIDHPLDPAGKYLYHTSIESPDMKNIYDGNIVTDEKGYATVTLPSYFEALNKDIRYQLTVIGTFAQAIVSEKVRDNRFVVRTDRPGVEVSWQVTGIRRDAYAEAHRVVPETEKPEAEKGTYLYPELFGQPAEKRTGHQKKD